MDRYVRKGEYQHFDGEQDIIFTLIDINWEFAETTVAVSNGGRTSIRTEELRDTDNRLYFEYGLMQDKIFLDEFK